MKISLVLGLLCASFVASAQEPWIYRDNPNWEPSWNKRAFPRAGACFFKDSGFQGDRFCVTKGDRLERLPGSFGDNISSIQLFGNARAIIFNDRRFSGGSQQIRTSVSDLRAVKFRGGHTWNNRISSLIIR